MQWHDGDISDAVNKVNEPNKFLIVFLRDDSISSTAYSDIFEKAEEMHLILSNCICLNLLKGKTEFQQFSDVYKSTEVPSIYVINYHGQVIDIIFDEIEQDKLIARLKKNVVVNEEAKNDSKCASNSVGGGEAEGPDFDFKMTEIRQKLAEKHRKRQEEEKAKEIDEELNRRDLGKKLVELKKFQKEQEENEIKEEIRRKRQEDKDARSKVLRQIEEDKLERKNRFVKQDNAAAGTALEKERIDDVEVRNRSTMGSTCSSVARLQFRFPDGSSKNNTFDCNAHFAIVREFVSAHVREHWNNKKFEIKQFFPKKTLSHNDDSLSLKELELVPSASLAVIFVDTVASSIQITSFTNLLLKPINYTLLTVLSLLQWLRLRLFGGVSERGTQQPVVDWQERQRRLMATESRTIKKDGNMAQFSDTGKQKDDKEDDATWNGNSTQQM